MEWEGPVMQNGKPTSTVKGMQTRSFLMSSDAVSCGP